MRVTQRFATRHALWFALASIAVWLVLLIVFMGLASGVLRRPYGDGLSVTIARLTCAAGVVALVWRLGWLRPSGFGQLGGWRIWLLTLGGLIYFGGASLYSFYGKVGIDPSILIRLPAAPATRSIYW